jgi:predicted nucleic acid-binding protein
MIVDASVWVATGHTRFAACATSWTERSLGDRAVALAASCRLRGADAVFVALAETLDQPLITLDREILERASRLVEAETPDVWVHRHSSG